MKLYKATITIETYVLTDDEYDTRDIINSEWRDVAQFDNYELSTEEITNPNHYVPVNWRGGIPFGGEDDSTIEEILKRMEAKTE